VKIFVVHRSHDFVALSHCEHVARREQKGNTLPSEVSVSNVTRGIVLLGPFGHNIL
jgi:hypothetical protein